MPSSYLIPYVPFPFCPQSLPASGSFPMSQLFTSGGQSIGVSASALVLPMNTQDWSPLGWTGWISLQSKGLFKSLLQHHSSKASILWRSAFFIVQLSHPYMTTGKTIALTRWTFVGEVISLLLWDLLNMYRSSMFFSYLEWEIVKEMHAHFFKESVLTRIKNNIFKVIWNLLYKLSMINNR